MFWRKIYKFTLIRKFLLRRSCCAEENETVFWKDKEFSGSEIQVGIHEEKLQVPSLCIVGMDKISRY